MGSSAGLVLKLKTDKYFVKVMFGYLNTLDV